MKKKVISYEEVAISQELRAKCIEFLNKTDRTVYWDRGDCLSVEQVDKAMKEKDGWDNLESEILENNIDYICDLEYEILEELKQEFDELQDIELSDLRDEFLDYLKVNFDIEGLLRNTCNIRVRVVIHSNYEGCGWQDREGDPSFKHNDYVKAIRKLLKGKYEEKSFQQELDNICSSVNQFIFYFKCDAKVLRNIKEGWQKITIPKQAWAGFYDTWNGSGSVLEVELTDDITLKRQYGKTEYDTVEIVVDEANKYSVENVYGLCNVPEVNITVK